MNSSELETFVLKLFQVLNIQLGGFFNKTMSLQNGFHFHVSFNNNKIFMQKELEYSMIVPKKHNKEMQRGRDEDQRT